MALVQKTPTPSGNHPIEQVGVEELEDIIAADADDDIRILVGSGEAWVLQACQQQIHLGGQTIGFIASSPWPESEPSGPVVVLIVA